VFPSSKTSSLKNEFVVPIPHAPMVMATTKDAADTRKMEENMLNFGLLLK
jgi:hypothetical protein